jgi:hypothetical protein
MGTSCLKELDGCLQRSKIPQAAQAGSVRAFDPIQQIVSLTRTSGRRRLLVRVDGPFATALTDDREGGQGGAFCRLRS